MMNKIFLVILFLFFVPKLFCQEVIYSLPIKGKITVTDIDREYIAKCKKFIYNYVAEVDKDDSINIFLQTLDTNLYIRMRTSVRFTGAIISKYYEDSERIYENTNRLIPFNYNRNCEDTIEIIMCHTPNFGELGTELPISIPYGIDGTVDELKIPDSDRDLILKNNTKYLLTIISQSNGNKITILFDFSQELFKP